MYSCDSQSSHGATSFWIDDANKFVRFVRIKALLKFAKNFKKITQIWAF